MLNGRTLEYPTAKVLERLQANRETHVAEYNEAMEGFRQERKALIDSHIAFVSAPIPEAKTDTQWLRLVSGALSKINALQRPQSHEEEYTQAIDMLGFTSQETVELDTNAFNQYIRDDWSWKKAFSASTANYLADKRG